MQDFNGGPRLDFTAAEIVWLIRDNPAVITDAGLELLDMNLSLIEDISDRLQRGGSEIKRSNYADVHETCSLSIVGELDWGTALVRPYYLMIHPDGRKARFNLGAYFTVEPDDEVESTPRSFTVEGIGILDRLNDAVGDSYAVPAGAGYLAAAAAILTEQGYTRYQLDNSQAGKTLATARTWAIDENPTWLGIVNDLLQAVGYAGIYADWDGQLRGRPYQSPSERPSEWTYDTGLYTSMITGKRARRRDLYRAPNRWVFVRNSDVEGPPPTEGNGRYTFTNTNDGPTSVSARGGRTITKGPIGLDAADQDSLVRTAQATIDADKRPNITVPVPTAPNPLHWHFDRLTMNDPDLGPIAQVLSQEWSLPLDGSDMSHVWSVL